MDGWIWPQAGMRLKNCRNDEAPRSKPRGILSGIAPRPYQPSLLQAAARSPRHFSLQQAAEYPGEGEWIFHGIR